MAEICKSIPKASEVKGSTDETTKDVGKSANPKTKSKKGKSKSVKKKTK